MGLYAHESSAAPLHQGVWKFAVPRRYNLPLPWNGRGGRLQLETLYFVLRPIEEQSRNSHILFLFLRTLLAFSHPFPLFPSLPHCRASAALLPLVPYASTGFDRCKAWSCRCACTCESSKSLCVLVCAWQFCEYVFFYFKIIIMIHSAQNTCAMCGSSTLHPMSRVSTWRAGVLDGNKPGTCARIFPCILLISAEPTTTAFTQPFPIFFQILDMTPPALLLSSLLFLLFFSFQALW